MGYEILWGSANSWSMAQYFGDPASRTGERMLDVSGADESELDDDADGDGGDIFPR